jgi:hypothetical protein
VSGGYPAAGSRPEACARYASRLAEHGDRNLAAEEIGISQSYGRVLWGIIVRGLGWQAQ